MSACGASFPAGCGRAALAAEITQLKLLISQIERTDTTPGESVTLHRDSSGRQQ